jgi:hypothetical protein
VGWLYKKGGGDSISMGEAPPQRGRTSSRVFPLGLVARRLCGGCDSIYLASKRLVTRNPRGIQSLQSSIKIYALGHWVAPHAYTSTLQCLQKHIGGAWGDSDTALISHALRSREAWKRLDKAVLGGSRCINKSDSSWVGHTGNVDYFFLFNYILNPPPFYSIKHESLMVGLLRN